MKKIDASKQQHKFISGLGRCLRCQIKEDYLYRAIATLESWPEKEKGAEWKDRVLSYLTCPAIGSGGWKGPDNTIVFWVRICQIR